MKIKKNKQTGDHYIYDGVKNPTILFNGTYKECFCLREMLLFYPSVNVNDAINWVKKNRKEIDRTEEETELSISCLTAAYQMINEVKGSTKEKLLKIKGIDKIL